MGQKGKVVIDFFTAIFEVIMRMVSGVMWLTPFGISSVIAGKILDVDDLGLVMSQLAWFIATVLIGVVFYQFIIMQVNINIFSSIFFSVYANACFRFNIGKMKRINFYDN